jgi:hypothetical protein
LLLTEKLQSHDAAGRASNDRVVTGVVIQKLCLKLPLVGMQCYVWTLSGLRENLKIILTFLFRAAASEMWKLNKGTVSSIGEGAEYQEGHVLYQVTSICGQK